MAIGLATAAVLPLLVAFGIIRPLLGLLLTPAWVLLAWAVVTSRLSVASECAPQPPSPTLPEPDSASSDVIRDFCHSALNIDGVTAAAVCLLDLATGALILEAAEWGPRGRAAAPFSSCEVIVAPERTAAHDCIGAASVLQCERSRLEPCLDQVMSPGSHSFTLVPLTACRTVLGVAVLATDPEMLTASALEQIQALARHCSLALTSVLSSDLLELSLGRLRAVSDAMVRIGLEANVSEVRSAIVNAARTALDTDLVALFTIDPNTGDMECCSTDSVASPAESAFLQTYGSQVTNRGITDGWIVEDVSREPDIADSCRQAFATCSITGMLACPIRSDVSVSGALVAFYRAGIWLADAKLQIMETVAAQASTAISYATTVEQSRFLLDDLAGANQELSQQASADGLTGLANHRSFQQTLAEQFRKSASNGRPFSLVMVDVDHFKVYNDMHGHQEGDEVLRKVALGMTAGLRQGDMAARYGGEEFALILPNSTKDVASKAADRIRRGIADLPYSRGTVTVSMGVAEFPTDGSTPAELIESADKALYHAKITGRNRVFVWGSPSSSINEDASTIEQCISKCVLLVDHDQAELSHQITEALELSGTSVVRASGTIEATELLKTRVFDISLVSMEALPDGDLRALATLAAIHPHMPIVLMASELPAQTSRDALRRGASDILLRPFNPAELPLVVERNLERHRLELQRLVQKSTGIMLQAIEALVAAIDAKDPYTAGHSQRVVELSLAISEQINLSSEERYALELAAKLHDIGKLALPDSALNKQSPLTEEEWRAMREHPAVGARIVGAIDELAYVSTIVRHHHERLDGTGYPDGLRGPAIPHLARIIAVADAYEAMTSERAHRSRLTPLEAIQELSRHAGTYYSADIVQVLKEQLAARGEIVEGRGTAAA